MAESASELGTQQKDLALGAGAGLCQLGWQGMGSCLTCCRARMVSPPRPMILPTMPWGQSTDSLCSAPSSDTSISISCLAFSTDSWVGPACEGVREWGHALGLHLILCRCLW